MQNIPDHSAEPRAALMAALGDKVRALAAAPSDQSLASVLRRAKLSSEVTALNAQIFGIAGVEGEKEAKAYFQEHMQGRVIGTVAGDVHLFGSGFGEMKRGMRKDALKVKLIRRVIEILQSGKYAGRTLPHKERTDELVAFHFFSKSVTVDSLTVKAGVNVGERSDGLLAWGLGHEFSVAWVRRAGEKKPDPLLAPGYEPGVESGMDSVAANQSEIMAAFSDSVNLVVLEVKDAQGNRIPELEDTPSTDAVVADPAVLDGVSGALARLRLTATLSSKVAELAAMAGGEGGTYMMRRARLASEVNQLCIELGGKGLSSAHETTLSEIAAGRRDGEGLAALYSLIQTAVRALQDAGGLSVEVEQSAQLAITHWAELEEVAHA